MNFPGNLDFRIAKYLGRKLNSFVFLKEKRRKEIKDKKWLQLFADSEFMIHKLSEELNIKLYRDSVLSKLIYEGFEEDEIDFLKCFLEEGDCFVDIGANVGLFTLYASKIIGSSGTAIAFEPSESTFTRLQENIALNDLKNVRPFKLGLSNEERVLELNISESGYEAWNTFVETQENRYSKKEKVQVKRFDDFFEEINSGVENIKLIKLDVEGFELNVLNGAAKLLSREVAPVFLVEFTDANANAAGHCCHEIYKLLTAFGYRWYKYDAKRKKLTFDPMQIVYPYVNLIAIKNAENLKRLSKFQLQFS